MSIRLRQQTLAVGLAALLMGVGPHLAVAQSALTGTVLSGARLSGGAAGSARLGLGSRIVSPPRSWTEVVFSDGSSIVLGPGAELTVHQIASDLTSARSRVVASASGQIRIAAMDGTEVQLAIAGAEIRVVAADAVLQTVPHGSVAMMGGLEVVVSQRSRRDTLRRPGFSVALDGSSPRRDTTQQAVAELAPFGYAAPSQPPVAAETAVPTPAPRARRNPALAALPPAPTTTDVATAGSTELTRGLTAQSGSFTLSPTLKIPVPASTSTSSLPAIVPTSFNATPTVTPGQNNTIPDSNYSSYTTPPSGTAPAPAPAPPVPTPTPNPAPTPQPSFVAVDSIILTGFPESAGSITVPGTTTTVSAGLVPSNEHLTWGFFVPVGSTAATALANPNLTFQITSTALPAGSLQMLSGTATYAGGLIGNALGTASSVRPTGQFAQTWDFGKRSGAFNANFDGSTWRGVAVTMPSGTSGYAGSGSSTADQRSSAVQGGFYNSTPVSPGGFPGATGGTFSVGVSSTGRQSTGGIFVGTRR